MTLSEPHPCCGAQTPQRTNKGKLIQAPRSEGNLRKPADEAGFAWIHVTNPFLIGKTDSLWNRNVITISVHQLKRQRCVFQIYLP